MKDELKQRLSYYQKQLIIANKKKRNAWQVIGLEQLIQETKYQMYDLNLKEVR